MGWGLVAEVMDWAPATLTHREHKVLMILAEDAHDPGKPNERIVWRGVESVQTLRRARVSRAEMYAVIASLIVKGCLERSVTGGRHHAARYKLIPLRLENPDTENPDANDSLRLENPDTETGVDDSSASGFCKISVRVLQDQRLGIPDAYPEETRTPEKIDPADGANSAPSSPADFNSVKIDDEYSEAW